MGNTNLSDKSREALNSETFQKIREDMKDEIVKEYLKNGYADEDKQHEITISGVTYKILEREKFTTFYDWLGNTLFDVDNEELAALSEINYGEMKDAGRKLEPEEITDAFEKENDSTEKTADAAESGKLEEDKDKTEQSIPVYSGVDGAIAKLQAELEKAKEKEFAKPVIEYLMERCRQSESLAADISQSHKTWEKCYKYIYEEARKKLNSKSGPVRDDVVFEWAEDYFHLDDKALEEKKAKEEAERKKKSAEKKKQDTEKKGKTTSVKSPKSGKKEEKKPAVSNLQREVQKPKPKKNELDGQIDFFSMMGM